MAPPKRNHGNHSSGTHFAMRLKQPTRMTGAEPPGFHLSSLFGLAPGGVYLAVKRHRRRGGLLPHPFTLTPPPQQSICDCSGGGAVYFLWHFPWGRPRRTLSGTVVPWSPDFPRSAAFRLYAVRGCPADWRLLDSRAAAKWPEPKRRELHHFGY